MNEVILLVLGLFNGAAVVFFMMRNPKQIVGPKIIATVGLRRQIGVEYLDIQFNITDDLDEAGVIDKVVTNFDLSGTCHEKIKQEMEAENRKKVASLMEKDRVKNTRSGS